MMRDILLYRRAVGEEQQTNVSRLVSNWNLSAERFVFFPPEPSLVGKADDVSQIVRSRTVDKFSLV
jgi:hypothetical protein